MAASDGTLAMEEGYELDLTYITERIIAVSFPVVCSEDAYRANLHDVTCMLKSKHADNYLVRSSRGVGREGGGAGPLAII